MSYFSYSFLIRLGVGREQARGVLVPSVYVSWVWTGSLQTVLNFIQLREGEGAQSEIAQYAKVIKGLTETVAPIAVKAWLKNYGEEVDTPTGV